MNDLFKSIHWKNYVINFAFLIIALIVFIFSLYTYLNQKERLLLSEQAMLQQRSANNTAEQTVTQLKNSFQEYQLLRQQGLVGDPPRLEWAEVLFDQFSGNRIPGLFFVLSPTAISKPEEDFFTSDTVEIRKTPMKVNFNLLHEGDFYHYLTALHEQAKGMFSVQECMIDRDESAENINRFKGQCDILWFSMADITRDWPEGISL